MPRAGNVKRRKPGGASQSGAGRVRLAVAVILASIAGAAAYLYLDYRQFATTPLVPLGAPVVVDVPLGTPLPGVLRILDHQGIRTGNPWYWRALTRELGIAGKLHAGEYSLAPGLTPTDLLKKMAAGDVVQHHFTIVEGWTFKQLRSALAQDSSLHQTLAAVDDRDICKPRVLRRRVGSCPKPTAT
jgi:peptidoglycan lytic transglycosylase G